MSFSVGKLLDFINVFTIFVGVNFLGLPYTVSVVGIIVSYIIFMSMFRPFSGFLFQPAIAILFGIVVVTYHGCSLLLLCKERVEQRKLRDSAESLLEIEKSLKLGYAILAKDAFGPSGELLVTVSIFLIHFCFCTGYVIFLGNAMESLAEEFHHAEVCSTHGLHKRELSGVNLTKRHWSPNANFTKVSDKGVVNISEFSFFNFGNLTQDVEVDCTFQPKEAPQFQFLVWLISPIFIILCLPNLQLLRDMLNILSFFTFVIVYISLAGWLINR